MKGLRQSFIAQIVNGARSYDPQNFDKELINSQLDSFSTNALLNICTNRGSWLFDKNIMTASCGYANDAICYRILMWEEKYAPYAPPVRDESYDAAPMVMRDLPSYPCPITGKMITSRSHHRENLKKHGCEVAEPSIKRDNWAQEKADDHSRKKLMNDILSSNGYH